MFSDILLTVDFDRTLTAPDSSIPERNLEAIRYFMDNGGTFTLNTGRSVPMSAHNIIACVPVNAPLLLYNGSAAYDPATGQLSQCHILPVDHQAFIEDLSERFPELVVELQGVDAHYLFRKNPVWEAYNAHNHCAWGYTTTDRMPQPVIKVSLNGEFRDVTVAAMYEATPEDLRLFDEAIGYVRAQYGEQVEVFRACARIADIHARGCSKRNAAKQLQKALGKGILICVGDGENDVSMLEGADYGFCPADAVIADRFENVCRCAAGAVADVIYEKIPDILKNKP